jgi:PAS domain S-box-containing protein
MEGKAASKQGAKRRRMRGARGRSSKALISPPDGLLDSADGFRVLFEHSPDAILLMDPHDASGLWPIVACNDVACRMNGYSREDLLGAPISMLDPRQQEPGEAVAFLRRIREQGTILTETTHYHKDGHVFPVEASVSMVVIDGRELVLGIDRDISARRRMEEALRESEERFHRLADAAFEGIVVHENGIIIDANQRAAALFGYTVAEMIGHHVLEYAAEEARNEIMARLKIGSERPYEVIGRRKDGSMVHLELRGKPLPYHGRTVRVVALRDLSEQKESEARFAALFENSPDAIMLIDPGDPTGVWPIVDCNQNACSMNGYRRDELVGQPIDLLHPEPADPVFRQAYLEQLRRDGTMHLQAVHRHKDGHLIPIEVATSLIRLEGRELVLGIDRDITDRKQAETALGHQAAILDAVRYAAERFLMGSDWRQRIELVLERLGTSARVSRVYLFENEPDTGKPRSTSQRYEWVAPGIPPQIENGALQAFVFREQGFERWEQELSQGSPIVGHVRDLPETERSVLTTQDIRSVLVVPVFVEQEWWGMLGFDQCDGERSWSVVELDAIKAAANTLGAAIERRSAADALERAYAELEQRVVRRTSELSRANEQLKTTVNDLIRVQQELRQSEQRYRSLTIASAQIIWTTGASGEVEDMPMWRAFTGQSRQAVKGDGWLNAIHPEDRERTALIWQEAVASRSLYQTEYRVRRADGVYRTFSVRGVPILEHDGEVREFVGACADITEARRAQEREHFLSEASTILSASLDYPTTLSTVAQLAVPTFADWCLVDILGTDGILRRVAIAHASAELTAQARLLLERYPVDANAPLGPSHVVATGQAELQPVVSEELIDQLTRHRVLRFLLQKLGLTSYISVPLRIHDRLLGAMTFVRATSGVRYDEEDLRFAGELAHRAAYAVENAGLYLAAQEAIQAREDFLSVAAHELKTPLTGLMGYTQLLWQRAQHELVLSDRDRFALNVIYDQAERLHQRIESLLDLSRLQAGQFVIEPAPMDLGQLLIRVVEQVQPTLERHSLILDCPDGPLPMLGDEGRLDEALVNLLQNAVKYSPQGGPISVNVLADVDTVRVAITDHGIGIPLSQQPLIFDRFYRGRNVRRVQSGGMGIGLYVVKEIVERHAGTVEVQSNEGSGSTFTIVLPLLRDGVSH